MTADEIGRLTIAEVEAIVARATDALTKFREAQALLGGGHMRSPEGFVPVELDGVTHAVPRAPAIVRGAPNPLLTAAENAERARLIKLNTMGPDDIDAMERA